MRVPGPHEGFEWVCDWMGIMHLLVSVALMHRLHLRNSRRSHPSAVLILHELPPTLSGSGPMHEELAYIGFPHERWAPS